MKKREWKEKRRKMNCNKEKLRKKRGKRNGGREKMEKDVGECKERGKERL